MNIIEKAISNNFHISSDPKLNTQTWEEFENFTVNKKLFVFGVGRLLEIFCDTYLNGRIIEGVLDNDIQKHDMQISTYCSYTENVTFRTPAIMRPDELLNYDNGNTVILIFSISSYMEIISQLRELGYTNNYVAVIMAAKNYSGVNWDKYTKEYYAQEFSQYPICNNKIIFYAMGRYSGHGKAITESLLMLGRKLDIVWIVMRDHMKINVPEGVRLVCISNQRKIIYEMETAKCWIYEHPVSKDYIKRPEQYYIQAKHWSSITLKTFGRMLHEFRNEPEAVANWEYNGEIMDYVFVGSDFDEETCRRGFCFDKDVIRVGSPRSDILFRGQEIKDRIFKLYHIDLNTKIIMYAPTFRFDKDTETCQDVIGKTHLDFFSLKDTLERKFGGNWMILLRFHPLNHPKDGNISLPPFVIDVTDYDDGEELVAISDIMITDYSSIMFELAFVRRPVFLYAPDRNEYIDQERELLIEYDSLPFDIAENNEELCNDICRFDIEQYRKKVDSFMDKYGVCEDGHASERAAKFVADLIK